MPVQVQTLDGGLGLYFYPVGVLTVKEVLPALDIPENILRAARYSLIDMAGIQATDLTGAHVRRIVARDRENVSTNPDIVQAFLAPKELPFGLGRMYSALSEPGGWPTAAFRHRMDAEQWIREEVGLELTFEADYPLRERWE